MQYGFNLNKQSLLDDIEHFENYALQLYRNKVLLSGNAAIVEKFYKEDIAKFTVGNVNRFEILTNQYAFWSKVGKGNARVFFGISKMINDAFVRLLTSGGVTFTVQRGEEVDEAKTQRLDEILTENKFYDRLWGLGVSYESGFGFAPYKISIDEAFDFPLIELVNPFQTEAIMKRGHIMGFKFKKRYELEGKPYEVHEIITRDKIEYRLWDVDAEDYITFSNEYIRLFGLDFLEAGLEFTDLAGLSDMPVILKNNTAYNSMFPKSPFGEADITGLHTIEDALSEVVSSMVDEIRHGKIKVMIDSSLTKLDKDGNPLNFDEFKIEHLVFEGDATVNERIKVIQGKIEAQKYMDAAKQLIMYACNKANIHPITVGITGLESINSAAESQQEREKVSLRTREMKLEAWHEALVNIGRLLLEADDIMNGVAIGDYDIAVEFGQFTNPNPESVIDLLGKAIQNGVVSIAEAQETYNENKAPEEVELMYLQTLVEKGLPLTPEQRDRYSTLINDKFGYTARPVTVVEGV